MLCSLKIFAAGCAALIERDWRDRFTSDSVAVMISNLRMLAPATMCRSMAAPNTAGVRRTSLAQLGFADLDLAVFFELDDIDRAGVLRRARVVGFNVAVADRDGLIPMAEGDVVGVDGEQLFTMDQPGADHAIGITLFINIVAMGGGKLPAGALWLGIGEWRHVGVIDMGMAPNLQLKFGEEYGLAAVQAENIDIGYIGQAAAPIDRVRCQRIMIAR